MSAISQDKAKQDLPGLDTLAGAISESAQTARNLLTAMLLVALTMAATMIAATDEALFRDSAEVFPSLGVKVTLSTAYALAPPVFVFLHINAVLQLHLLAGRLRAYERQLAGYGENTRAAWRRLIHGFVFAQLLAGTETTDGSRWSRLPHRTVMAFAAWLAIAAIPVLLLITAQISFVRYQSDAITTVHQVSLAIDLALLAWFHRSTWGRMVACRWASGTWSALAAAAAMMLLWLSWTQAVPPLAKEEAEDVRWSWADRQSSLWKNHYEHVILATITREAPNAFDRICGVSDSRWTCRYLKLADQTPINADAKPELVKHFGMSDEVLAKAQRKMVALSVPDRPFRFADFSGVQLFSVNMSGVDGRKAYFAGALMPGANLASAQLQGATLGEAKLQGADLRDAQLQGADLSAARLQGVRLDFARLQGADLEGSELHGARLFLTNLDLATGNAKGCDEAVIARKPPMARDDAISASSEALDDPVIADKKQGILDRVDNVGGLSCDGKPFPFAHYKGSTDYALALTNIACDDASDANDIMFDFGILIALENQRGRRMAPEWRAISRAVLETMSKRDCQILIPYKESLTQFLADQTAKQK